MEYTLAASVTFAFALAVAVLRNQLQRPAFWLGLFAFLCMTVVADSTLIALGVFGYAAAFKSGLTVVRAPVEDLLYGAALYTLAVSAYGWRPWRSGRLTELLRASRPFSWINTALPCLACGIASGRPGLALGLGTLYFLAPYNLLLYGVNDAFDFESDRLNPRKGGAIEGGLITPASRRRLAAAIAITNVPILAVIVWLAGPVVAGALLVTVAVALVYSVPPLRTKVVAGLDSLTSSLHFVLPAVCGGLLAGAALGELPWRYLAAFLLWGVASQAMGAIQDVDFDRAAGIGSIAVSLGPRNTGLVAVTLYLASVAVVASGGGLAVLAAIAILPYPMLAASCLGEGGIRQARSAWKGFLGMNLLSGFLVTQVLLRAWGWVQVGPLEMLAWGSAGGAAVLLLLLVANERLMRRRGRKGPIETVTVVIPVRNEESRIAACLEALPRGVEVIVVDDGSTDATLTVASEAIGGTARVVEAGDLPSGWTGKCWAAWKGSQLATREILVFIDADTALRPGAIEAAAGEAADGGLVSFLTRYEMRTAGERILMPAFALVQLAVWPLGFLPLAYGPFMAVRRGDYIAAGGHRAIAGSTRDELDLARLFARDGKRVRLLHGADLGSTRHYDSARQAIAAWRRMFYEYSSRSLAVALAGIAGLATVLLLPPALFIAALAAGDASAMVGAATGTAILIALRVVIAVLERQPLGTAMWHPLTWLVTLAAMLLSAADGLRGKSPSWRGRDMTPAPQ